MIDGKFKFTEKEKYKTSKKKTCSILEKSHSIIETINQFRLKFCRTRKRKKRTRKLKRPKEYRYGVTSTTFLNGWATKY